MFERSQKNWFRQYSMTSLCLGLLLVLCSWPISHALADAPTGVLEPEGFRMDTYRAPVPETLQGARVVEVDAAEELWRSAEAVFIDVYPQAPKPPGLPKTTVWRAPKHKSIAGATWLANVGYGVLRPQLEAFFKSELVRLTDGNTEKAIVFFCLRDCWMSWNAAKRAVQWGYKNVVWFPDGTDGWGDFELPTAMLSARLVEEVKASQATPER